MFPILTFLAKLIGLFSAIVLIWLGLTFVAWWVPFIAFPMAGIVWEYWPRPTKEMPTGDWKLPYFRIFIGRMVITAVLIGVGMSAVSQFKSKVYRQLGCLGFFSQV